MAAYAAIQDFTIEKNTNDGTPQAPVSYIAGDLNLTAEQLYPFVYELLLHGVIISDLGGDILAGSSGVGSGALGSSALGA